MKTNLQTNGNTWHLYINKTIIKFLGITNTERTVLLTLENNILHIRKISNEEIDNFKHLFCKKLVKRGSGYGLNFPISLLKLLDINPEKDQIEFDINGQILTIKKAEE